MILKTHPSYFRYLTLMAFHAFKKESVDVSIIEVGIGGEYDATNILQTPTVTAITSLGIDHQSILGDAIEKITWHKTGVFKEGSDAVYIQQNEDACMDIIEDRAAERKVNTIIINRISLIKRFVL